MIEICNKCMKPAVTFIRYNGTYLCEDHFFQYFDRRVKKDLKKQGKTENNTKFGIAVSGGKDSSVVLHIIHDIFSKRKTIKLVAISVDEGIMGYRDRSLKLATENCNKLGIEHRIISFKDIFGTTMDDISKKKGELGECSYCGVFRRICLNRAAKDLNVDRLVTGHNLDDMVQSILMNFVNGDIEKLARLGPHLKIQPGLIPRFFPLRIIPEKEVALYAILKNIPFYDDKCPYSFSAFRGIIRDIIDDLEYKNPGTRHSIMSSYDSIKNCLVENFPPVNLNKCSECGEPTTKKICKACILKKKII
jgi:uncharacterized protein (TIGR00269 family)